MLDIALDNRIFLETEIDCALQELDLLFNTENTQLIGYPQYGTNFESFLWTLTPTTNEIETYINEKISKETMYASRMNVRVRAMHINGEYRSIYYIKIILTDSQGNTGTREYQYQ